MRRMGVRWGGRKMPVPEGKFTEKEREGYGRERGKEMCEVCYGTCCAAVRDLVRRLVDNKELKLDIKVREI